ncbi:Putative zincin peptidase [Salinibacillus kushneri]|uniref:Putative zincin peptidase n=1 Tax=Salinibacillus kushneri TaxID=237682 RepID=A0A1I0AWH3_9BACI|nr:DUF3267 domain-containing protein [Salinibacillus kushneri]SES98834.1 Putative zincin peptidase [Salinibacillus kushneri]
MNNCWKTVNVTREFGQSRLYLMSSFLAFFTFILLFLPYSIYHQNIVIKDHGFIPLLIILMTLPTVHQMAHVIPLILCYKRTKINWDLAFKCIPILRVRPRSSLSKKPSIFMWFGPTLFLTVPGLITGAVLGNYYPYILLFVALNIGMSFKDFFYIKQFLKAPKKCKIEDAKDGYDILIQKKHP